MSYVNRLCAKVQNFNHKRRQDEFSSQIKKYTAHLCRGNLVAKHHRLLNALRNLKYSRPSPAESMPEWAVHPLGPAFRRYRYFFNRLGTAPSFRHLQRATRRRVKMSHQLRMAFAANYIIKTLNLEARNKNKAEKSWSRKHTDLKIPQVKAQDRSDSPVGFKYPPSSTDR